MEKLKKIKNILVKYYAFWLMLLLLLLFSTTQQSFAQGIENVEPEYPYQSTFVLTAYYSPLPDQERYVTGSYEADVRLNGEGVHSADGSIVYMGMIAAPKNFKFGTKIDIPGLGIGTVHDRGGAINNNRLDIWMGYGQEGMDRALGFGMPTITGTVLGPAPDVKETLDFTNVKLARNPGIYAKTKYFKRDLGVGDESSEVVELQRLLTELGYYNGELTPFFGTQTMNAVLEFQLDNKVIKSDDDKGAGVFGPRTRVAFEKVLDSRNLTPKAENLIPQKIANVKVVPYKVAYVAQIFSKEMQRGDKGKDVERLQKELYRLSFLRIQATGFYGEVTEHAVFKFQQAMGIVQTKKDSGAGYVGPMTRQKLHQIIAKREEQTRLIAEATKKHTSVLASLPAGTTPVTTSPTLSTHTVAPQQTPRAFTQLSFGARSEEVRSLQKVLKTLGYFSGHLTSDYFGDITKEALAKFQLKSGLIVNEKDPNAGVYDEKTAQALQKLIEG